MSFHRFRPIWSILLLPTFFSAPSFAEPSSTSLDGRWQMQSSCIDKSPAEAISTSGFPATNWHAAEVPGTVVAALVADKTLPDPNFGMNLKTFPGISLGGEEPFSNRDMPADSPYRCSFWFRTEFVTPRNAATKSTWLHFLGINYRANIWLNGKKIADRADVGSVVDAEKMEPCRFCGRVPRSDEFG